MQADEWCPEGRHDKLRPLLPAIFLPTYSPSQVYINLGFLPAVAHSFSFLFLTSSLKLLSFLLLLPRHLLLYLLFIFQAFFLITLSTGWLWFLLLTHVCCTLPLPNPLLRYPPLPQVSGRLHQTNGITRVKSKLELWTLGNSFYPQGKSSFRWSNCIHSQMLTCIPAQTHAFKILSSFQLP